MNEHLNITVLMGGPDAERAVSLDSGRAIAQGLRDCGGFNVTEHVIDEPTATIPVQDVDVFFPALHGPWGEGGPLQRILEFTGVPYVGSGPEASALCMDKWAAKQALIELRGFRTPHAAAFIASEVCPIEPPVVLKPINDGSSVDVYICRNASELAAAQQTFQPQQEILAERYIDGRELTVSVLCDRVLPIIEIIPGVAFYDYDAKYARNDTRYEIDPSLPKVFADQCIAMAQLSFDTLGCRDLARVDFMCDDTGPWFLEVNTIPGFTSHSLMPKAAVAAGIDFTGLCAKLVHAALSRSPAPIRSA